MQMCGSDIASKEHASSSEPINFVYFVCCWKFFHFTFCWNLNRERTQFKHRRWMVDLSRECTHCVDSDGWTQKPIVLNVNETMSNSQYTVSNSFFFIAELQIRAGSLIWPNHKFRLLFITSFNFMIELNDLVVAARTCVGVSVCREKSVAFIFKFVHLFPLLLFRHFLISVKHDNSFHFNSHSLCGNRKEQGVHTLPWLKISNVKFWE